MTKFLLDGLCSVGGQTWGHFMCCSYINMKKKMLCYNLFLKLSAANAQYHLSIIWSIPVASSGKYGVPVVWLLNMQILRAVVMTLESHTPKLACLQIFAVMLCRYTQWIQFGCEDGIVSFEHCFHCKWMLLQERLSTQWTINRPPLKTSWLQLVAQPSARLSDIEETIMASLTAC